MASRVSRRMRSPDSEQIVFEQKLDRAEQFYQQHLKAKLERKFRGQAVAIDPETHEYFVARDKLEAHKLAREKYPGKSLYLRGIGYVARIGPRGIKLGR